MAQDNFEKAVNINPSVSLYWKNYGNKIKFDICNLISYNTATTLEKLLNFNEAIIKYEKAIQLNPFAASLWISLGTPFFTKLIL